MQKTLESNQKNIAILQAIFMRKIAEKLKKGLTKRQAVKATIEESKNVFLDWQN
jgi:6,7-dimethyl-8-ribityllumazine synthase